VTEQTTLPHKPQETDVSHRQKLLMVLGMHRSGTSAITKGLEVLGVTLGDNLLPPKDDNPKGFFEDRDLVNLNERVLEKVGRKWHALSPISPDDLTKSSLMNERIEAGSLLSRKFSESPTIGLKDPRLSVLLPFWTSVIDDSQTGCGFVIPVRNPLEVALSLNKRNGMSITRATALWGRYMSDAVRATEGRTRLFVDFDSILEEPLTQLRRISDAFGLAMPDPKSPELISYRDEFLEQKLKSNKVSSRELGLSGDTIKSVIELYNGVLKLAKLPGDDRKATSNKSLEAALKRFDEIAPLARNMDALEDIAGASQNYANAQTKAVRTLEKQLHEVQTAHDSACEQRDKARADAKSASDRAETIQHAHDQACRERDDARLELSNASEKLQQVAHAHGLAVTEREQIRAELDATSGALHTANESLRAIREELADLQQRHDILSAEADAQRGQVKSYRAIAQYEIQSSAHLRDALSRSEAEIDRFRNSTSWKITAPLRATLRFVRGETSDETVQRRPRSRVSRRLLRLLSSGDATVGRLPPPALPAVLRASEGETPTRTEPWLAVVIHAFYPALLPEILDRLAHTKVPLKLYVTTPLNQLVNVQPILEAQDRPYALIETENRGRDVAPFLSAMRWVNKDKPDYVLKLHTKKSVHLENGENWRGHLFESLLGLDGPQRALTIFESSPDIGLLGPDGHVLSTVDYLGSNGSTISAILPRLGIEQEGFESSGFIAGTMFYARHEVVKDLTDELITITEFDLEHGQTDGTMAHAVERITGALANKQGYRLASIGNSSQHTLPLQKGAYRYL